MLRCDPKLPLLFAATLFASAVLLFSVQPMIAKMLLPLLGGTPAVWNTCMVFFQTMLLAGYAYAHLVTTRLRLRNQIVLHLTLLLLAALALPIAIPESAIGSLPRQSSPSFWLLGCLLTAVGLPFFITSTSAPLLQQWFSKSQDQSARDPYFLYTASNLGSLVALLGYPVIIEPNLRLQEQSWSWNFGYALFGTLLVLCAIGVWRNRSTPPPTADQSKENHEITVAASVEPLALRQRLRWIILSFVPSSLMLGVTTYLTTDLASIPLLWVLPLAIYLATFILAFARRRIFPEGLAGRALPIGAVGLTYLILTEATQPAWLVILLHLLFLFIAAMFCHGQVAQSRPSTAYLTEFYFWISLGGVLGGIFNALLAPNLFSRVIEYPIAVVVACLLRQPERLSSSLRQRLLDFIFPVSLGLFAVLLVRMAPYFSEWPLQARLVFLFGLPALVCYTMVDRPIRFSLALGALILASVFYAGPHGRTLHVERNFFGVLRVTLDPSGTLHRLVHGNTLHGRQFIDPARHYEPLSYYHQTGPLGQIFQVFNARPSASKVAVVGLGAGSMACYAGPQQSWTFYEINPAVIRIASNTNFFTFLNKCTAAKTDLILGDARLRLRDAPDAAYDLILLDAFSSDAIPIHLITRQALDLYLSKLAEGGMLAFHISNRYLDLEPVLGALAKKGHLLCHAHDEQEPSPEEQANGKDQSHWVVMARQREDLGRLTKDSRWAPVSAPKNAALWTDDFSNILSVFIF